ncbi:hypothetical protein [Sciscionella marina]|uniref:hypothetical protein n=1 Tax=Sciscionella marina TaxID=508770 RepID=UPI00036AD36C|nr:hypothetical protein [Sciscionella marina]
MIAAIRDGLRALISVRLVLGGCHGAAGDVAEGGQAEVDGGSPAGPLVELGEFLFGAGEADLESLDFAVPAFSLGFGDAVKQIAADLDDSLPLCGIRPEKAAS